MTHKGRNLLIDPHFFIFTNERPSVFEMVLFSVKTCDSLYVGLISCCVFHAEVQMEMPVLPLIV